MPIRFPRRAIVPPLLALSAVVVLGLWQALPAYAAGAHLTVSQTSGLSDGQTVRVDGAGYRPNVGLFVAECDTSVPNGGACDMTGFKQVTTDATGAFSVSLQLAKTFGAGVDCAVKPCGIQTSAVQTPADLSQQITVLLHFGGTSPAPSTSAAPVPTPATTAVATALASGAQAGSAPPTTAATAGHRPVAAKAADSGGSALPWVIAVIVVVVVGGGAGGYWLLRRRGSGAA